MKIGVKQCVRCTGAHEEVDFRELIRPSDGWSMWGICPSTREPIMLRLAGGDQAKRPLVLGEIPAGAGTLQDTADYPLPPQLRDPIPREGVGLADLPRSVSADTIRAIAQQAALDAVCLILGKQGGQAPAPEPGTPGAQEQQEGFRKYLERQQAAEQAESMQAAYRQAIQDNKKQEEGIRQHREQRENIKTAAPLPLDGLISMESELSSKPREMDFTKPARRMIPPEPIGGEL